MKKVREIRKACISISSLQMSRIMTLCCGNVPSHKQDSVWSWLICCCSVICMILTVGFAFALGVLLPVFMESFNESRERTGKVKYWYKLVVAAGVEIIQILK